MTSFEDKILASVKIRAEGINASSFISNLRAKRLALRFEIKLEALIPSALIFTEAKILSSKLVII